MDGQRVETPCDHCPLIGTGKTCPRFASNHVRYCEWVDPDHPGFLHGGREKLIQLAGLPRPPIAPATTPEGPTPKPSGCGCGSKRPAVSRNHPPAHI